MAFWIEDIAPLRLAIMPRPRGGDWLAEEMQTLRREGADIVVSLLGSDEIAELELNEEAEACASAQIEFRNFGVPDRDTPESGKDFCEFASGIHREAANGKAIVAHCRAGIGRSAMLLAMVLVRAGYSVDDAFQRISAARGYPTPDTKKQLEWVRRFSA